MADEQIPHVEIQMVYLGSRRINKKRHWLWVEVTEAENDGSRLKFDMASDKSHAYYGKRNISPSAQPGTIISINASPDRKSVYPGSSRVVGSWENAEDVAEWSLLQTATEREFASESKANRDIKAKLPTERLAPFRRAYQRARNEAQRQIILAWVIREITRYDAKEIP